MYKISDTVDRKFVDSIQVDDWMIESEGGWVDITHINITVEYDVYQLTTSSCFVECADDHIVFRETGEEVFVKDLSPGDAIKGQNGIEYVISVNKTDRSEHMADLTVTGNHTFYAHGLLHHNTTTVAAYLAWYLIFNDAKTVAILANKATAAREIMSRLQLMIENLPKWLQQGVVEWNKGSVAFENESKAFTAATSSSGIRGKSCVTGDTRVCVEQDGGFFYVEIDRILNNSILVDVKNNMKKYAVYKTTNTHNNKIYIGFHSIQEEKILRTERGNLSCFEDGYLGSGKLLKRALEKYGPESFDQEILGVFENREDAESLERTLVNSEFVERDDTYNVSLGGNVTILFGENNGFYGRKHTPETLAKIQESRNASKLPTYQVMGTDVATGTVFKGYSEILQYYKYIDESSKNKASKRRIFIGKLCHEGTLILSKKEIQENVIEKYLEHLEITSEESIAKRKQIQAELCRERFTGKNHSEEHAQQLADGLRKWKEENPDLHIERMMKINTNPEKIRKTAEKHRGMKRSADACKNISESLKGKVPVNKGKKCYIHPETSTRIRLDPGVAPPEGYVPDGAGGKKKIGKCSYTNGKQFKLYLPGTEPDGWWKQGPPKNRK